MLSLKYRSAFAPAVFLTLLLCNCVHIYQPYARLAEPTLYFFQANGFKDLNVKTRCRTLTEDWDLASDEVCLMTENWLSQQGAKVVTPESGLKPDLVLFFESLKLEEVNNRWMYLPWILTFSFFPVKSHLTFQVDLSVRDGAEVLLGRERLQGRFIVVNGIGYYGLNFLMNTFFRPEEDKLSFENVSLQFSRDFFGRVSQILYDSSVALKLSQTPVLEKVEP